jgi:hypothetical protein
MAITGIVGAVPGEGRLYCPSPRQFGAHAEEGVHAVIALA